MSLLKSKKFHSALGALVSIALILYFAFKLDWHEVGAQLLRVHYIVFVPMILGVIIHMLLRAQRWRYFLPQGNRVSGQVLFDSIMLGALATFILPGRVGEIVRPYALSRKSSVPFPIGFASVVIERFFDLAAVLISFGVLTLLMPGMDPKIYVGAQVLGTMALAILACIILGAFAPGVVRTLSKSCCQIFPERFRGMILHFVEQLIEATVVLKNPANLGMAVLFTALVWGSNYVVYYIYTYLVDVEPSMLLAVAVAIVLAFAVALPSTPGFIGVYQAGCIVGFNLFGYSEATGMTFAIVTHVFQYAVFVVYGGYLMLRDNLHMADLRGAGDPAIDSRKNTTIIT